MAYSDTILADSPDAYYRFESTETALTDETGNYPGSTLHGAPVFSTGLIDNAVSFPSVSDYVEFGNGQYLIPNGVDTASVECWFKVDPLPGWVNQSGDRSNALRIVGGGASWHFSTSSRNWSIMMRRGDGSVGDPSGYKGTIAVDHSSAVLSSVDYVSTSWDDGLWHHIVCYLGSNLELWIDAELIGSISTGGLNHTSSSVTTVGFSPYYNTDYPATIFPGQVDEFAVYHRRLDLGQLVSHYIAGGGDAALGRVGGQLTQVALDPGSVDSQVAGQVVQVVTDQSVKGFVGSQVVQVAIEPPSELKVAHVAEQLLVAGEDTSTKISYVGFQLLGKSFAQQTGSVNFSRSRVFDLDLSQETDTIYQRSRNLLATPGISISGSIEFLRGRNLLTLNTSSASVVFQRSRSLIGWILRVGFVEFNRGRDLLSDGAFYRIGEVQFDRVRDSSYVWKPPKQGDLPTDPLLTVGSSSTRTITLDGFTRSQEETDFGATGVGVAWVKIMPAQDPSSVVVQNVATSKGDIMLFGLDDPVLPASFDNLVPLADETADLAEGHYAGFPMYLMIDIHNQSGTMDLIFTIEPIPDVIEVETDVDTVFISPAVLDVSISASSGVTEVDVDFDGQQIAGGLELQDGNWAGQLVIPLRPAGVYELSARSLNVMQSPELRAVSPAVMITVLNDQVQVVSDPITPPPPVPPEAVNKWLINDPVSGQNYVFPMNPSTASSNFYDRVHSTESTTKPVSFVVHQGSSPAKRFTFSGVLVDRKMYQDLLFWSSISRRLYLIDHQGVAFQVVFEEFDVQPRTNPYNPHVQDYTMTVLLIAGPFATGVA